MSIFLLLFLHMILKVHSESEEIGKIVGGQATDIRHFPYAVRFYNSDAFCSGCILNSWTILTAAHCVNFSTDINDMSVDVGSSYLQDYDSKSYDVTSFEIHENYSKPILFAADIALLFVNGPIKLNAHVQKAILSRNNKWRNDKSDDIVVTGWGWTKEKNSETASIIQRTTLRYVPMKICEKAHKMKFTKDMFCLYGEGSRDTCQGDSGGAVEWKGEIIGIVSHGHGCAEKGKPSLYVSVMPYKQWIEKKIQNFVDRYCRMKRKKRGPRQLEVDSIPEQFKIKVQDLITPL